MRKNLCVLLVANTLMWFAGTAGAQAASTPQTVTPHTQENLKSSSKTSGLDIFGKPPKAAPAASRAPKKPLILLNEKNLGLGCAQPS